MQAPHPRVAISDRGYLEIEDEEQGDDEVLEGLDTELRGYRYYKSDKALGDLFRAIDESKFLHDMQQHRLALLAPAAQRLTKRVLAYVKHYAKQYGVQYDHHLALARYIKTDYEDSLTDIMHDFEPSPHNPLTETEVFAGSILGRQGGVQGKPLRELSKTMRERFGTVVEYAGMRIIKGDEIMQATEYLDDLYETYSDREIEALPRAIACLQVAEQEQSYRRRRDVGELKSFAYLAAAACLRELERYRITTFGVYGLPPMLV